MIATTHDFGDGLGRVAAHKHPNGGGWVAESATVADTVYVGPDARVSRKARVSGKARVFGDARVYGEARVYGDARVGSELTGYDLSDVPRVENLDRKIAAAIKVGDLDMSGWHTCATTHCRAGWAIHLAGERGYALEKKVGSWLAGASIYVKSTGRTVVPDFFATTDVAREDIERCARGAG